MDTRFTILTEAAKSRADEILGYQINITNYSLLLEDLPADEMPELLKNPASDTDIKAAALYAFRDDIRQRKLLEEIECDKSQRVLAVLQKQLQ